MVCVCSARRPIPFARQRTARSSRSGWPRSASRPRPRARPPRSRADWPWGARWAFPCSCAAPSRLVGSARALPRTTRRCARCWSARCRGRARSSWTSRCAGGRRSSTRSCATARATASPSATWRTSIPSASTPATRSSSRPRRRCPTKTTSACAPPRCASCTTWASSASATCSLPRTRAQTPTALSK